MSLPVAGKKQQKPGVSATAENVTSSKTLMDAARAGPAALLTQLATQADGLSDEEATRRLEERGYNDVAREQHISVWKRLFDIVRNPLIVLLIVLAVVSYITDDKDATIIIVVLAAVSVLLRFFQERNADTAAAKLKAMVSTTATVIRGGVRKEIPLREIAPGDVVALSAGDMVPADIRLLSTKDLFINQAALTGESMPVEKTSAVPDASIKDAMSMPDLCFLGSNIESGTATGVVVFTGKDTFFGSLANRITAQPVVTSFDKGVNSFTWLMISFMAVMAPLVFIINGLSKGNWIQAFLFSLAVAVGLTPEMLPMIVTVNLSQGAIVMSRKKVIVKRLNAIQNFGAMDILCTDKTGTITQGKVVLERYLDIHGQEQEKILEFAYLNSYFQTGLKNLMDVAVLNHLDLKTSLVLSRHYQKVDEIPFDFVRKRMSVVIEDKPNEHILICKGASEEVLGLCTQLEVDGSVLPLTPEHIEEARSLVRKLNEDGFRVLTLAYKMVTTESETGTHTFSVRDESSLILLGFLAFFNPPRESANEALQKLHSHNIDVKILTGDNEVVTGSICRQVGLPAEHILLGGAIEDMDDDALAEAAAGTTVFARLSPNHKERIIRALQRKEHVVGFLGDGINDAPALKAADVGISVDSAVDIAKESSDVILLETSLLVLGEGVLEGRKVFGNITKYLKMAASSNFGNVFSIVGGSIFLPFLPMLPLQVLINNLLYDFSQTTIPTDKVDPEWLAKPRKWSISNIRRFIFFIGPISSIFDYATFLIMIYVFGAWTKPVLFHTGWFVESLFTQTLIIHVIRTNKIPFIQSRASLAMLLSSLIVVAIGAGLTFTPLASPLGLVRLPATYWLFLTAILVCYVMLTQVVKTWFYKRFGD
jgi:Mg2+-importing ATPase